MYVFSLKEDDHIHGCIRGDGKVWNTTEFQILGLADTLSIEDVGPEYGLSFPLSKSVAGNYESSVQ